MKSTVLFVVLLLSSVPLIDAAAFYYVNGTNYFIGHPMVKNWHQAERYCTFHGMHLLTINTPVENDAVLQIIKDMNPTSPHVHFWTSGTDAGHAKHDWYWSETGAPILYTNWVDGVPSAGDNHCIILHGGGQNYKWFDQPCHAIHSFICQDRLTMPDTLSAQRCQHEG